MDPAAGAQPQPPQTVPAGGEQPQRQPLDIQSAIDGLNDESEIASLLFSEPQVPSPTAEPAPSGKGPGDPPPADPQPDPNPAAGTEPQQEPTEPTEPPAPQATPNLERISLKSLHPDDRLLIANAKELVREGKAPRLADAIQMLTQEGAGTREPTPPAAAQADPNPEPQPDPVPDLASELQALEQTLESLQAERDQAIEEYDRPKEINLTKDIEKLNRQIAKAEALAEIQNQQAAVQQQSLQATIEDIYADYPESEDPKSFFSYRMTQELDAYEASHGPIARHPQQLRTIAENVARELGQPRGTQQQAPAAQTVQPRQKAQPIGTAAPGSAAAVRVSPDQLQKAINEADEATLHAALFGSP